MSKMLKKSLENKILQGDCLEVLKTLPEESVDCVVTSPPYNKGNKPSGQNWVNSNIDYGLYKDDRDELEYQEWQKRIIRECLRVIKPSGSIFYNHKPRQTNHTMILPTDWLSEFDIRQVIIWDRGSTPDINPICFYKTTEWIIWIKKDIPKFNKKMAIHKEVWSFGPDMNNEHPAPFPITLPMICIQATTDEGDTVLDPFMGSGTTVLAAQNLKRNYIGIELNPEYIKMAEKRLRQEILI